MSALQRSLRSSVGSWLFLTVVLIVNGLTLLRTHIGLDAAKQQALTVGLFFDLTLTIPISYYFLVARPRNQSRAVFAFIFAICILRASLLLPMSNPFRGGLGVVLEGTVVAFVVSRVWQRRKCIDKALDPILRVRIALQEIIPIPQITRLLGSEFSAFYYAFALPGRRAHIPAGGKAFTMHEKSGVGILFGFLSGISLVEAGVMHLVVSRWCVPAAWLLTGLSIYGAVWLAAISRSFALRPSFVEEHGVTLRLGLLRQIYLPLRNISEVRTVGTPCPAPRTPGYVSFAALAEPSILISLRMPVSLERPLGFSKKIVLIGVAPDDMRGFSHALNTLCSR